MLFNSIDFALFLPIVFILYWFVFNKKLRLQNILIVGASYLFYGWWDWRFLGLIVFSTLVDFIVAKTLFTEQNILKRKALLWTSVAVNLGFLGFFKYYNFFLENFISAFSFFGSEINSNSLDIILPVGISFYTFQTLSYTIDVYKRKLEPAADLICFSAFVGFFPQLVAGPIERASNLLPQFYKKRSFDYSKSVDGVRQILWGLFKKVVIADNCAEYANLIFNNSEDMTGSTLVLGAVLFAFQIYGDFSGYSDIAIGTSRLFGFNLKQNFNFPYFSRDIAEFWRRWHISLSTWFRDYLYIPLGGSRGGTWFKVRNTFVVFIVSGFWHGANWTFIFWGALNAIYFLPLLLTKNNRNHLKTVAHGRILPSLKVFFQMLLTFTMVVLAWVFFRADNLSHAFIYINEMFLGLFHSEGYTETISLLDSEVGYTTPLLVVLFIAIEWLGREGQYAIENIAQKWPPFYRYTFYYLIVFTIMYFGNFSENQFIYFQF